MGMGIRVRQGFFAFLCLLLALGFCPGSVQARSILYTQEELWLVGELWKRIAVAFSAEQARYRDRLEAIESSSSMSEDHKAIGPSGNSPGIEPTGRNLRWSAIRYRKC